MHKLPSAQEIFNKVSTHLLTQGRAARNSKGCCRYRTADGLSCAVGCLIPDEFYRPSFEGHSTDKIIRALYTCGRADWFEHQDLLRELQWVHDENYPLEDGSFNIKTLRAGLANIAARFQLEFFA